MSTHPLSSRLSSIIETLPSDIQQELITRHLLPILDRIPASETDNLLLAASRLENEYKNIPRLNLKTKQSEVDGQLEQLKRHIKRDFGIPGIRSEEQWEMMAEIAFSIAVWMNDIWSVVHEYAVDFKLAHECLMYSYSSLAQVRCCGASCKCAFMSMEFPLTIKDRHGSIVKSWNFEGAHHLEEVFIWIWRELFLSMLATGRTTDLKMLPNMLAEVEGHGWAVVDLIWYGGKAPAGHPSRLDDPKTDDEDSNDPDDFGSEDEDEEDPDDTDEDVDVDVDVETDEHKCSGPNFSESHWTPIITQQLPTLRTHILNTLISIFKSNPSHALFKSIIGLSTTDLETKEDLLASLRQNAVYSSITTGVALRIGIREYEIETIAAVLKSSSHLIRDADINMYQIATHLLSHYAEHRSFALGILSKELKATLRAIESSLSIPFPHMARQDRKDVLAEIMKTKSSARATKVEEWVESVSSIYVNFPGNPIHFAAMLMGFPPPPVDGDTTDFMDGDDPLSNMVVHPTDPDYVDLMDAYRPMLKDRWDGWLTTAHSIGANPKAIQAMLNKLNKELVDKLPWIRDREVVAELVSRIGDKKSKAHICEAIESLASFHRSQRKKATTNKPTTGRSTGPRPAAPPTTGPSTTKPSTSKQRAAVDLDVD